MIEIENFKPYRANTLVGFCTVVVTKMHMRIHDVSIHEKDGKRWVSLPARPMLDKAGVALKDDSGKTKYAPVIEFTDRETRDRFSNAVLAALIEFAPAAFEPEPV